MRQTLGGLLLVLVACGGDPTPLVSFDTGLGDVGADAQEDVGDDADVEDLRDAADPHDVARDVGLDIGGDSADALSDLDGADGSDADASFDSDPDIPNDDPLGLISGVCGELADALDDETPSFFAAAIDFEDDPFDDPTDVPRLTPGAQAVLEAGNAGGSSLYSEVFAFDILARCDAAELLETERTIEYRPDHTGSITDFLVSIDGQAVGVSVTRAVGFPRDEPYTVDRASELLADKLADVLESSAGVSEEDAWVKQVLVVIAYADGHVDSLRTAALDVEPEIAADTIVYVVESVGDDEWLY